MSDKQPVVIVKDLYKSFKLPHEQHSGIKQFIVNFAKQKKGYETQHVLEDVSFEIKQGEFFGIVGRNGSGKSTLLKLLAGIYAPDKGLVHVKGSLTPFIELGVGFNPELTGRENIFMNGALLGFGKKEMEAMYDDIVEFAELERFMDQKLKNYSSGMQVRLAFSIAIRAKSDVLLIDEVLAVGDAAFQTKCFDYFQELKQSNTTVIFISHDRTSLERFCDRGILVDRGKIIQEGPIQKVLNSYSKVVLEEMDDKEEKVEKKPNKKRPREVSITSTKTFGEGMSEKTKFTFGEKIYAQFEVSFHKSIEDPIFGITLWQKNVPKAVFANNTLMDHVETGSYKKGDKVKFTIQLPEFMNDGEYSLETAVANNAASTFYDQQPDAAKFFIHGSNNPHGLLSSSEHIKLSRNK